MENITLPKTDTVIVVEPAEESLFPKKFERDLQDHLDHVEGDRLSGYFLPENRPYFGDTSRYDAIIREEYEALDVSALISQDTKSITLLGGNLRGRMLDVFDKIFESENNIDYVAFPATAILTESECDDADPENAETLEDELRAHEYPIMEVAANTLGDFAASLAENGYGARIHYNGLEVASVDPEEGKHSVTLDLLLQE